MNDIELSRMAADDVANALDSCARDIEWRDEMIGRLQDLIAIKVKILDSAALAKIAPATVAKYLSGQGWHLARSGGDSPDIWAKYRPDQSINLAVYVPLKQWKEYPDYGEIMGRVVTAIANDEDRSQLQVLRDLYILEGGE
jgi:hypothetical protein